MRFGIRCEILLRLFVTAGITVTLLSALPAFAQGEHGRRAAAELLIMRGDLRQLTARPAPSAQHIKGLKDRLHGSLTTIAVLLRLADEEAGRPPPDTNALEQNLRQSLKQNNTRELDAKLSDLIKTYALRTTGILPADPSPERLAKGKEIHESLCAGCHNEPDLDTQRPARNLTAQLKTMSAQEFVARLIIGVRGDRVTGISNPFSDDDLNALIAFYRSNQAH